MLIIGITGTLGAGKGTIVEHLRRRHGFRHYSVRDLLSEIIRSRGMEVNRDSMVAVANELRARHSPSYLVERLYDRARQAGGRCVIESIRTPGEAEALRRLGAFTLFAVDAAPRTRYDRIRARGSSTDGVSYEQFLSNEAREMRSDDPTRQNLSSCMALAEFTFRNDGSVEELHRQVEAALAAIEKHDQAV